MSKPILAQLFDGEIYPAEQIRLTTPEAKTTSNKLDEERKHFFEILPEAEKERFESLCDLFTDMQYHYSHADFSCGFKLGTRLAYAALEGNVGRVDHEREVEERFDREMREALLKEAQEINGQ